MERNRYLYTHHFLRNVQNRRGHICGERMRVQNVEKLHVANKKKKDLQAPREDKHIG